MKKINNESGFSGLESIVVILVIIILGLVGWLVYKDNHKTSTTPPKSTSTSNTTNSRTPGWNTYKSTLGGFSFKYPASGWTLEGLASNGISWVTGSAITSNENSLILYENVGHGLSTNKTMYSIMINVGNLGDVGPITGVTESYLYGQGSIIGTLSNGISLWETSEKTFNNPQEGCGANGNGFISLNLASKGNLYIQLPNGEYLSMTAGFCGGPQQTLTLTYQQQINDQEMTIAKEVLASISY